MKKVRTTQLILDGVALPYVSGDRYSAHPATLSRQVEMISGRVVSEERGKVWRITYSADYIDATTCRAALAVLRAGTPVTAAFLPDNGDGVGRGGARRESDRPDLRIYLSRRAALAQRRLHAAGGEAA